MSSSKKTNHSEEYEPIANIKLLDETFDCLHRTARSMCQTLGRPKDRVLCRQTLHDLTMFNRSECTQIKHYVHTYLKFYLKALRWTQVNQPMLVYKKWVSEVREGREWVIQDICDLQFGDACHNTSSDPPSQNEIHVWLEDGQSYLAMKHFDDGSTMIYSAVANDPSAGWVDGGLKKLVEQMENS